MVETARTLFARMLEGFMAPRASARRVLEERWGLDVAIQLAVLAYVLAAIVAIVIPVDRPADAAPPMVLRLGVGVIFQVLMVGATGALVWGIGRLFGGTGERDQALVLVAWHTLVTVLVAPLTQISIVGLTTALPAETDLAEMGAVDMSDVPIWIPFLFGIALAAKAWLLAAFTAELHGFRSPWAVLGAMVAVSALLSTFLLSVG